MSRTWRTRSVACWRTARRVAPTSSATARTRPSPSSPRRPRPRSARPARSPAPTTRHAHAWATTSPRCCCSTRPLMPRGLAWTSAGSRRIRAWWMSSGPGATARSPREHDEAADRLAIRELVDAYAFCADIREAAGQKALFTDDTHFVVYMGGEGCDPTDDLRGREALTPVFDGLNAYEVTMHFNGQSTVALDGDRATGETYCLAHHVYPADGDRRLMIAALC